jgi:hypothetical protein
MNCLPISSIPHLVFRQAVNGMLLKHWNHSYEVSSDNNHDDGRVIIYIIVCSFFLFYLVISITIGFLTDNNNHISAPMLLKYGHNN